MTCPERIDVDARQDSSGFVHPHHPQAAAHRALPCVCLATVPFCRRYGLWGCVDKRHVDGAKDAQHRGHQLWRQVSQDTLADDICNPASFEHSHEARRPRALPLNRRRDVREPVVRTFWKRHRALWRNDAPPGACSGTV
eukprot:3774560-Rhodomonas_salina.2